MSHGEKRKFIRLDSLHLLDYIAIDESGARGQYSMGRTLDVSVNGLKMETAYAMSKSDTLEITVGVEEDLVDLVARIAYTSPSGERFTSGIEFIKMSAEGRRVFRRYTEAFRKMQEEKQGQSK